MYLNDGEADLYDLLYQDRKDYRAEAELVARLVRERTADPTSLLDVACGTGLHLAAFASVFDHVEGVDLAEPMLAVARRRLPGVPLHLADMRDFRLGREFDALVCMFSSIGYLRSTVDLDRALVSMARHLSPGGVLVIEPWYFPENFLDGHVSGHAFTVGNRTISRVSHSTLDGDAARMEIHYVVAEGGVGVHHRSEVDRLTLFARDDYERAFRQAGLKPEFVGSEGSGPGFFVGVAE
ncbi:dTDP-3-amino-3,4,6-trideoxy-alpha-D-glucopyranose N,N-dimethyltransferase [Saccharothrix carnea]|uniref:dTDP-3-amino-3,4, 6-trideoxy-alpha-D-glucopyranose N,N-dimethyltransferase n=1 Tax=Saccharothrix carnea TaxID=1280637 RepID=A0A2P8I2M4_SACCR|nr:class I SAM-dependent methyltransferase [Saccharothrix carnea]PSL52703.1 dTDP-3-amino-3,4,6-trideoxy-alpha-D-glucopyranose N,N-dimethyltransferase [Saccharothrix carnea]